MVTYKKIVFKTHAKSWDGAISPWWLKAINCCCKVFHLSEMFPGVMVTNLLIVTYTTVFDSTEIAQTLLQKTQRSLHNIFLDIVKGTEKRFEWKLFTMHELNTTCLTNACALVFSEQSEPCFSKYEWFVSKTIHYQQIIGNQTGSLQMIRDDWEIVSRIFEEKQSVGRGGSRTAAASKMELFVITVNGWKTLTIMTKCSILDVAAVLDPPLHERWIKKCLKLSFYIYHWYYFSPITSYSAWLLVCQKVNCWFSVMLY